MKELNEYLRTLDTTFHCTELTIYLLDKKFNLLDIERFNSLLSANRSIQTIQFYGTSNERNLGLREAIKLKQLIEINRTIKVFDLRSCRLGDTGILELAYALQKNNTLTSLNLEANYFGEEGAKYLAKAIASNNSLKYLYICKNSVGNDGAISLATALKNNNSLTYLDLSENLISEKGALYIADALRENKSLSNLNLGDNAIRDNGAVSIAHALRDNHLLTNLNLSKNGIRDKGIIAIAEALQHNHNIEVINIDCNNPGLRSAIAIAKTLQMNKSIKFLSFFCYSKEGRELLEEALIRNNSLLFYNDNLTRVGQDISSITYKFRKLIDSFNPTAKLNNLISIISLFPDNIKDIGLTEWLVYHFSTYVYISKNELYYINSFLDMRSKNPEIIDSLKNLSAIYFKPAIYVSLYLSQKAEEFVSVNEHYVRYALKKCLFELLNSEGRNFDEIAESIGRNLNYLEPDVIDQKTMLHLVNALSSITKAIIKSYNLLDVSLKDKMKISISLADAIFHEYNRCSDIQQLLEAFISEKPANKIEYILAKSLKELANAVIEAHNQKSSLNKLNTYPTKKSFILNIAETINKFIEQFTVPDYDCETLSNIEATFNHAMKLYRICVNLRQDYYKAYCDSLNHFTNNQYLVTQTLENYDFKDYNTAQAFFNEASGPLIETAGEKIECYL
ncbi:MAG: hypothetical protein K0Q51_1356 [Rickettsiaceae bacterium]|jgi:hypothetical protein|nr:hypothetical protein [Rickettsiaceae bacterium]